MTHALPQRVTSIALQPEVWRDLHRAIGQSNRSRTEVCRLLAGTESNGHAVAAVSAECQNLSASETRFSLPVSDFERARASARSQGLTVLALVHTHPFGVARQSLADLDLPRTTGLLSVIAAMEDGVVRVACYGFFRNLIRPVRVEFLASS